MTQSSLNIKCIIFSVDCSRTLGLLSWYVFVILCRASSEVLILGKSGYRTFLQNWVLKEGLKKKSMEFSITGGDTEVTIFSQI